MNVEFSLSSETAKTKTIAHLRARGLSAGSGPIRLAYPFSVSVEDLTQGQAETAVRLARSVDPCAGLIVTSESLSRAALRA